MGDLSSAGSNSPAAMTSRSSSRQSDVINGNPGSRPLSGVSSPSSRGAVPPDQPDVVFVSPPDAAYMCPVCDRAMRYPVKLGDCGHRCCSACLVELVRLVTPPPPRTFRASGSIFVLIHTVGHGPLPRRNLKLS